MRGRKWVLLHLVLYPVLVFLLGYLSTRMRGGEDPVLFYVVAAVGWFAGLAWLVRRYEAYACPRCGTRVGLSSTRMPVTNLRPCPGCGLVRPLL